MSKHKSVYNCGGFKKAAAYCAGRGFGPSRHRAALEPKDIKAALRAANTKSGDKVEKVLNEPDSTSSVPQEKEDFQV